MMQVMLLLEPDLCIIDTGVGLACGRVCLFPSVAVVDRCRHEREAWRPRQMSVRVLPIVVNA